MNAGILNIHFPIGYWCTGHTGCTSIHGKMDIFGENGDALMSIVALDIHSFNAGAMLSIHSSQDGCVAEHMFSASR